MDLPLGDDEALPALRGNRNDDANAEASIPRDLRSIGARLRQRAVRAIFDDLNPRSQIVNDGAAIILYLLYPDLRQEIVQELRNWILFSECCEMQIILDMFFVLGELNVGEEIEQEHSEALLELVDVLGSLMVERSSLGRMPFPVDMIILPLSAPLGAIVVAKLLQYAQSVEHIKRITLSCENHHRAFRLDEVEQLVGSILNLNQLEGLEVEVDQTGFLLVELGARLKDLKNLSSLTIRGHNGDAPNELPNETQLIRNIQQISSLEWLHLYFVMLGESTVNLFSSSEGGYTKLLVDRCHFFDDGDTDPRELPLAVALASNTRLEELSLHNLQGSGAFYDGIEHGLLNNRTLRTLIVSNYYGRGNQRIPEFAYFGWMQSIRLHPALRRLVLDMDSWSGRVADAVCSVVRENTSLYSMELLRNDGSRDEFDPEWVGAVLQALHANRIMVDVRIQANRPIVKGWNFGDQNWNRLAELLTVNDSIEIINLDAGDVSIPERLIQLLQRVKSNRTLKQLGLNNAKFHEHHTSDLVELLSDNFVLASLDFVHRYDTERGLGREHDQISCSDEGSQRLLSGILKLNYCGRNYMRTEPNSVLHGVSLLSHVSSNLDAVYFHLRENPRLCDRRKWK